MFIYFQEHYFLLTYYVLLLCFMFSLVTLVKIEKLRDCVYIYLEKSVLTWVKCSSTNICGLIVLIFFVNVRIRTFFSHFQNECAFYNYIKRVLPSHENIDATSISQTLLLVLIFACVSFQLTECTFHYVADKRNT